MVSGAAPETRKRAPPRAPGRPREGGLSHSRGGLPKGPGSAIMGASLFSLALSAAMTQLEELRAVARQFVTERGWDRHHNPKNLALAMSVEAAEVLEHFLWLPEAESFHLAPEKRREVGHELADVLLGVIRVADLLDIDLAAAFAEKMELNRQKYPPEKVQGRALKYTEL